LGLGDYDEAFAWLEEAYKEQSNLLQFLKVQPSMIPCARTPALKIYSAASDLIRQLYLRVTPTVRAQISLLFPVICGSNSKKRAKIFQLLTIRAF
jgi:hypothetical protein